MLVRNDHNALGQISPWFDLKTLNLSGSIEPKCRHVSSLLFLVSPRGAVSGNDRLSLRQGRSSPLPSSSRLPRRRLSLYATSASVTRQAWPSRPRLLRSLVPPRPNGSFSYCFLAASEKTVLMRYTLFGSVAVSKYRSSNYNGVLYSLYFFTYVTSNIELVNMNIPSRSEALRKSGKAITYPLLSKKEKKKKTELLLY